MPVASLHVVRYPDRRTALAAMARVPFDRRTLGRTPGTHFARLLGTGAGESTAPGADVRRWAVLTVWPAIEAADHFTTTHPLPARWRAAGAEVWQVLLEPLAVHGSWGGTQPFGSPRRDAAAAGPVAVLTRATVRLRRWRAFARAVPAVDARLAAQQGRLLSLGIGEWPVGQQATFSVWASAAAVRRFAYGDAEHRDVIRRTRAEGWYRSELFARLRPVRSSGTLGGRDPLAGVLPDHPADP